MRPISATAHGTAPPRPGGKRVAWLILVIALSATLLAWSFDRRAVENAAAARFEARGTELVQAIAARMDAYQQALRGGVALLRSSDKVTFVEWREYVASIDMEGHYPGILGMGYVAYVRPWQYQLFAQDIAAQTMPPFPLAPPSKQIYTPVTYIAPFDWRNRRAYGVDMYAEATRRAAIEQARDTGQPVLSAPVTLAQETGKDVQPGLLLYLPFYHGHPDTVEERRDQLVGLVYAPFRTTDLMQGILGTSIEDVQLSVYDGATVDTRRRIYVTGNETRAGLCTRESRRTIDVATRRWTVRVCSNTRFAATSDVVSERLILGTGTVISLLLFGIAWSLAHTRARAVAMAQQMTRELSEERTRLTEIAASLGEGLYVQDNAGVITYSNPAAAHLLDHPPGGLLGHRSAELLPPEARAGGIGTNSHAIERMRAGGNPYIPEETIFLRRDGSLLPVSVISTVILRDDKPAGSVVAFHDVSEQRRAETALREAQQFAALFDYSRDPLFLMDLNGCILDANRVALESLGYSRDELVGTPASRFVRWATVPQPGQNLAVFFDTLSASTVVRGEAEYTRKDGTSFFVEAAFSPLLHEHRKMILISARDITERKEAERRIQRALDDLEHSRREIEETNRRLAESNRELQRMSRRDGLTAIANRRFFDEYMDLEWNRAARDHRPLSLLMIDVDHFKAYNDHYGHPAGDDCLRRIAEAVDRQLSRSIDLVARYGGEEFVVVLPETPLAGAVNIGERLRAAVEELALPHAASPVAHSVTISVGAATMIPRPGDPKESLVAAADGALYRAKQSGRNRLCTAGSAEA